MFRWGIIGAGYVARKFVLGLRSSDEAMPALVCSRPRLMRARSRGTSASRRLVSVEDAVRLSDVDAFYIATPPSAHRDQTIVCLSAGKPVLVEKPFAASLGDAARRRFAVSHEARIEPFNRGDKPDLRQRALPGVEDVARPSRAKVEIRSRVNGFVRTRAMLDPKSESHPFAGGREIVRTFGCCARAVKSAGWSVVQETYGLSNELESKRVS
jgi:hypothetical protein